MKKNARNLFAWMVYDNVLEMRFAVPIKRLEEGDFHDKFGNFYNGDKVISYVGSINDSKKGFSNYEGIMVFPCWKESDRYFYMVRNKFKRLWENTDKNILCYKITEAVRNKIFKLRDEKRPYTLPPIKYNKWSHQDKAIEQFIYFKHGILEMDTGTGKTVIVRTVICTYGNDLLEQWYNETLLKLKKIRIFRYYETDYKELTPFLLCPKSCILILSLNTERVLESVKGLLKYGKNNYDKTLWVFDEVHRLGALSFKTGLKNKTLSISVGIECNTAQRI